MSKHLKIIGVVSTLTMVSRVLGLLSLTVQAQVFGASGLNSAFVAAFRIPNLFRRLLAEGAFTAAFVPTLQEELHHRAREGAFRLVNQAVSWLLVVSGGIVVVAIIGMKLALIGLDGGLISSKDPDVTLRWITETRLALILFPYLIFVCLAAAFSAALQSLHRFLEPALSPIWLNLAMIGALSGAFWGHWAGGDLWVCMRWLCYGALVGGFFQMAVPGVALMTEGWRPAFDLRADPPVRQIARLMAPTLLGSAIYLINMTVSAQLALYVDDSSASLLNYGTRLMELPIGVFAIAISTVVFPLISKHAAAGNEEQLGAAYRKGMRLILVVNLPAAAGLCVLARQIIRVLYQHGSFTADNTAALAPVLIVLAAGLPFLAAASLMLRAFYAKKDTMTPVKAAAISFICNIVLSLLLMRPLGTVGLATASTVAVVVQTVFLQICLNRRNSRLAIGHLLLDIAKILVASAVMGIAVWAGDYAWHRVFAGKLVFAIAELVVLIGGGAGLYAALLWILHIEGRQDLAEMLARFRKKI